MKNYNDLYEKILNFQSKLNRDLSDKVILIIMNSRLYDLIKNEIHQDLLELGECIDSYPVEYWNSPPYIVFDYFDIVGTGMQTYPKINIDNSVLTTKIKLARITCQLRQKNLMNEKLYSKQISLYP